MTSGKKRLTGPTPGIPYSEALYSGALAVGGSHVTERWYVELFRTIVVSFVIGLIASFLMGWWQGPPLKPYFPPPSAPEVRQLKGTYQ